MTHDYEALTLREFGKFVGSGAVYQGHKPVLWCHVCETALADAEVEYKDAASPSIYVKFPFRDSVGEKVPQLAGRSGGVVIWTTTPWTLPSNLAIAFDPAATYVAVEMDGEALVVAADLQEAFLTLLAGLNWATQSPSLRSLVKPWKTRLASTHFWIGIPC